MEELHPFLTASRLAAEVHILNDEVHGLLLEDGQPFRQRSGARDASPVQRH